MRIKKQSNVIIRNIKSSKVVKGDGITVENSKNVWIDHCDLSSDMTHDKDYYDGLLDITHGSDWVTVSNTHFHDHVRSKPRHLDIFGSSRDCSSRLPWSATPIRTRVKTRGIST